MNGLTIQTLFQISILMYHRNCFVCLLYFLILNQRPFHRRGSFQQNLFGSPDRCSVAIKSDLIKVVSNETSQLLLTTTFINFTSINHSLTVVARHDKSLHLSRFNRFPRYLIPCFEINKCCKSEHFLASCGGPLVVKQDSYY